MNSTGKKLAGALLLAILTIISSHTLLAADEHAGHHSVTDTPTSIDAASTATDSPAMANMNNMRGQIAAIRAAKDPKERAKLLDEHMQTMQATTQMMQQDKGCMMMNGGMAVKNSTTGTGGMNMMQMMMEQMMQHQKAMQESGK